MYSKAYVFSLSPQGESERVGEIRTSRIILTYGR